MVAISDHFVSSPCLCSIRVRRHPPTSSADTSISSEPHRISATYRQTDRQPQRGATPRDAALLLLVGPRATCDAALQKTALLPASTVLVHGRLSCRQSLYLHNTRTVVRNAEHALAHTRVHTHTRTRTHTHTHTNTHTHEHTHTRTHTHRTCFAVSSASGSANPCAASLSSTAPPPSWSYQPAGKKK